MENVDIELVEPCAHDVSVQPIEDHKLVSAFGGLYRASRTVRCPSVACERGQ